MQTTKIQARSTSAVFKNSNDPPKKTGTPSNVVNRPQSEPKVRYNALTNARIATWTVKRQPLPSEAKNKETPGRAGTTLIRNVVNTSAAVNAVKPAAARPTEKHTTGKTLAKKTESFSKQATSKPITKRTENFTIAKPTVKAVEKATAKPAAKLVAKSASKEEIKIENEENSVSKVRAAIQTFEKNAPKTPKTNVIKLEQTRKTEPKIIKKTATFDVPIKKPAIKVSVKPWSSGSSDDIITNRQFTVRQLSKQGSLQGIGTAGE